MKIFNARNNISWRKISTCVVLVIFSIACIGYLIKKNFAELPKSYISIIGGVFAFYFVKSVREAISRTNTKKDENEKDNSSN